jgi:hypothetical protein
MVLAKKKSDELFAPFNRLEADRKYVSTEIYDISDMASLYEGSQASHICLSGNSSF